MEWEEHYENGTAMVAGAKQVIEGESKPIRFVNGKYKRVGQAESAWLYNIRYEAEGEELVLIETEKDDSMIRIPLKEVEYLKLRPFYFAACIGFKAFLFYNDDCIMDA